MLNYVQGKLQAQTIQKTANEWDRQRRRLEREHFELLARVDYLTDEVVLEKRLGIAQLCLLLIVLVFMALTRGSRGETFVPSKVALRHDSLKEWGRRHLSSLSSVDWAGKLRSRSRTPTLVSMERAGKGTDGNRTPQPNGKGLAASASSSSLRLREPAAIQTPHPRHFVSRRPVTPTSSAFAQSSSHRTPLNTLVYTTGSMSPGRPRLRRMNSHNSPIALSHTFSTGSTPPLSVKKFAKTAHLHEIRRVKSKSSSSAKKGANAHERQDSSASENIAIDNENFSPSDRNVHWPSKPLASDDEEREQSHLGMREPFSVLPLQNRPRSPQHYNSILSSPWRGSEQKIIDLDAEAENGWVDTDMEGSEAGDLRNS